MTRWFTTLLYALMLACAALPVHAAALANGAVAGAFDNVVETAAADSQGTSEQAAVSADVADASSNDGAAEVPELFFERMVGLVLPARMAEAPPSIAVPLSPHPFLKGPQRPPRVAA